MIKLSDWDRLYVHNFDWALRRMEPDSLDSYKDKEQDWIDSLKAFQKVKEELFQKYAVTYSSGDKFKRMCVKGLELNAEQLFELFHNHLNQYKNKTVRYFIFHWWNDLRYHVKGAQPVLDCAYDLMKDATQEEVKQATKDFGYIEEKVLDTVHKSTHTFDNARVLEYRGIRFPVDKEWGDAWYKKKNGEVKHFQLDWDWWYPIDECLDLYDLEGE